MAGQPAMPGCDAGGPAPLRCVLCGAPKGTCDCWRAVMMPDDAVGPRATMMDGAISVTDAARPMAPRTARGLAEALLRLAELAEAPAVAGQAPTTAVFVVVPRRGPGGTGDEG